MLIQSSGRVCSFFRVPLQVFRTMVFLVAEDPYFLFVDAQSKVSFAFILEIHLFLTSSFVGQASLGRSAHTLWFLRCQISIMDSAIRILYNQLSPGLGIPFGGFEFCESTSCDATYVAHYWPGARVSSFPYIFC